MSRPRRFEGRAAAASIGQPPEPPAPPAPADAAVVPTDTAPVPEELLHIERIEDIVDPTFLQNLSRASGGFYFVLIDPEQLPPGLQTQLGYTNRRTGGIYLLREAAVRLLQEPDGERSIRGFFAHEAGHHAPEVVRMQDKLVDVLGKQDMEPHELHEYFEMDEQMKELMLEDIPTRQLFWRAVNGDAWNGAADVWLEEFMGRDPFLGVRNDYRHLYRRILGRDAAFLQSMPFHHQLTQWLVGEERYYRASERMSRSKRNTMLQAKAEELLSPTVAKAVRELREKGAIEVLMDNKPWESWSATDKDYDRAIDQKFIAVTEYLFPQWKQLLLKQFEASVKEAVASVEQEEQRKLTKDEKKQVEFRVLRQLLHETIRRGNGAYASQTPDPQQEDKKNVKIDQIGPRPSKSADKITPALPSARDEMERGMRDRMAEYHRTRIEDLADRFGVDREDIERQQRIEKEYAQEIEDLANDIAESFLSQRRAETDRHHYEGELEPGMEPFVVAEAERGNLDIAAYQQLVQAIEFMQTEVEMLLDSSGSMQNNRLEMGWVLCVIIQRAFERVKAMIEDEQLLRPEEEDPLRVGYVLFADAPSRIKKLDEPITEKSLAQMMHQTRTYTGGTDDAGAITALTTEFKAREGRVLKFLIIVSDGEGNAAAVQNIMNTLEKDDDILVIVVGMGAKAQNVIDTFSTKARSAGTKNIFPVTGNDVRANVHTLGKYLCDKVRAKAEQMAA